ncbi:hypothetical protein PMAYCL1PPCAC_24912, partial [Pristionchus mayeri]
DGVVRFDAIPPLASLTMKDLTRANGNIINSFLKMARSDHPEARRGTSLLEENNPSDLQLWCAGKYLEPRRVDVETDWGDVGVAPTDLYDFVVELRKTNVAHVATPDPTLKSQMAPLVLALMLKKDRSSLRHKLTSLRLVAPSPNSSLRALTICPIAAHASYCEVQCKKVHLEPRPDHRIL